MVVNEGKVKLGCSLLIPR